MLGISRNYVHITSMSIDKKVVEQKSGCWNHISNLARNGHIQTGIICVLITAEVLIPVGKKFSEKKSIVMEEVIKIDFQQECIELILE